MSIRAISIVWKHAPAGGGKLVLLHALADWANDAGEGIWPAVPAMARKARLSDRQVQRLLRELEKERLLEPAGITQYGTHRYRLRLDRLQEMPVVYGSAADVAPGDNLSPGDICGAAGDKMSQKTTPMSPKPFTPFTPLTLSAAQQKNFADQETPTQLPVSWQLPADWRAWAATERPELGSRLDAIAETFLEYWRDRGTARNDWPAAWRKWVRRERTAAGANQNKGATNNETHPQHCADNYRSKRGEPTGAAAVLQTLGRHRGRIIDG